MRDESGGKGAVVAAPLQGEDSEVSGQDRDVKNAKLAVTRGYARLGDYSEPPPKRRMTMPVEIQ